MLIRSNLGLELHVSNNDCTKPTPLKCFRAINSPQTPAHRACNWTTVQRPLLFWFPPFGKGSDNYLLWAVTLLGFVGLALCGKTNPIAAMLLGSTLFFYSLIYYGIQHFTRYPTPSCGSAR